MIQKLRLLAALLSGLVVSPATVFATENEKPVTVNHVLKSLAVYPEKVVLSSKRSSVQLVVTGNYESGTARDLTRTVKYVSTNAKVASVSDARVVGVSNGRATITIEVGKHRVSVPVVIAGQQKPDPVSFQYETLAVLTKQGCNTGSCHGSPKGKGGFSLSLFAYDSQIDRKSLVRGGFNRRTNVYDPDESLMLKKPMLRVTHVGGKRLRKNDVGYAILKQWIYEGAKSDSPTAPECGKIVVFPGPQRVLRGESRHQQLSVLAYFSDGTVRDVTRIATYNSSDVKIASANSDGLVSGHARGQAAISVRYLDKLQSVFFTVVEDVEGFRWNTPPENNYVDRHVHAKLKQLQYLPSGTCGDAVFVRRIHLDLTGLLPTAGQTRRFLASNATAKRGKLIDRLLATDEFARHWASKDADLLRVNPQVLKDGRARLFANWLYQSWKKNQPFDEFARQIVTASGDTLRNPAANYFQGLGTAQEVAETTSQIFMGSRIQCAKCHNHPFENWTQSDYYRIAAVFHRVEKTGGMIAVANSGEMTHPSTGKVMRPWGLAANQTPTARKDLRRSAFASWLTKKGNPFFARVEVNRIWAHLMGRGIVEPVDDFRSSNPPANVELLDALAKDFESSGFDRKRIVRVICNSRTYQRATTTNRFNNTEDKLFSHAHVRMLTAEQLHDAIGYVTGTLEDTTRVHTLITKLAQQQGLLKESLESRRKRWETDQLQRIQAANVWGGGWWSLGTFSGKNSKATQTTSFIPEDKPIDLVAKAPGGRLWQRQTGWTDDRKIDLGKKRNSATYLYRVIHSRSLAKQKIQIDAADACRILLNGKLVFESNRPGRKTAAMEFRKGRNRLLVKVSNRRGASSFRFQMIGPKSKPLGLSFSGHVAEVLLKPSTERTRDEQRILTEHYHGSDSKLVSITQQLQKLSGWLDYATQRPYPQRTEFLKAFGQPQRATACTCERSNEPTLNRALQLLNGSEVRQRVLKSSQKYGKLKDKDIVTELYLTAFSRSPTKNEQAAVRKFLDQAESRTAAVQDLVWAIINTQEFLLQH